MRTTTVTIDSNTAEIEFPEYEAFIFNPLFCNVSTDSSISSLTFSVTDGTTSRTIDVYLYQGTAKIYFSRILQLFFDDYIHVRTMLFTISLLYNGSSVFQTSICGIWGGLNLGKRFGAYGEFNYNGKAWQEKTRVWFKKFPFTLSLYSDSLDDIYGSVDGGSEQVVEELTASTYTATAGKYSREGIFEVIPSIDFPDATRKAYYRRGTLTSVDVFDSTYDETFRYSSLSAQKANLIVNNEEYGYYLRWIDNVGEIQYYLFVKGKTTIKSKLADGEKSYESSYFGGMNYANIVRTMQVTATRTIKCCAVNLPEDIYEYVSTILTSPYIDAYLGKNPKGEEIWIPVNIDAQTAELSHNETLHDLEITFTFPDINAQTL